MHTAALLVALVPLGVRVPHLLWLRAVITTPRVKKKKRLPPLHVRVIFDNDLCVECSYTNQQNETERKMKIEQLADKLGSKESTISKDIARRV